MRKAPMAKDLDKLIIRLPEGMRDRIKLAADQHGVSMNEEVVNILLKYFPEPKSLESEIEPIRMRIKAIHGAASLPELKMLEYELDDLIRNIANGRIPVPDDAKQAVKDGQRAVSLYKLDATFKTEAEAKGEPDSD